MAVFFVANGYLLLGHVIFVGTMHRCLPPSNEGKIKCISSGWHLTLSENHWYTLQTTKDFINKILFIYIHNQIQQLKLQEN
jgi:hypothetical protein